MNLFIDQNLQKSAALPNANASASTAAIDLGAKTGSPVTEKFQVKVSTTASNGTNNGTQTITLQGSNEESANFADIPELAGITLTANASGFAASERQVNLPPGFNKKFLRAAAVSANSGAGVNGVLTLSLAF